MRKTAEIDARPDMHLAQEQEPETLTLSLTHTEMHQLHSVMWYDRNKTRKLIRKGICEDGDLSASDAVWEKLQALYFRNVGGRRHG